MALATQCPYCHTTFRVASDQLKLRGGIVRCGSCQRIFDGSAHLIDLDALAAAKKAREAQGDDAAAPADALTAPVYTLDFDHTFDPFGILPKAEPAVAPTAATQDDAPSAQPLDDATAANAAEAADSDAHAAPDLPAAPPDGEAAADAPAELQADEQADVQPSVGDDAQADVPVGVAADEPADQPADAQPDAQSVVPQAGEAGPILLPDLSQDRIETETELVIEPGFEPETEPGFDVPDSAQADAEPEAEPDADAGTEPEAESNAAALPESEPSSPLSEVASPAFEPPSPVPEPEPAASAIEPAHVPASAYAPAGRIEPSFDLPVDEALVAQPLRGDDADLDAELAPDAASEHGQSPPAADGAAATQRPSDATDIPLSALPLRASVDAEAGRLPERADAAASTSASRSARAKAVDARARRSKLTPTRIEAPKLRVPAEHDSDEPEFVKRSRRKEQSGKTVRILMAVGAAILLLLLATQLLLNFRNELALRYPAARPALTGFCALAGCRVGLPAQAENLVIDDGELAPIGADSYSLDTTLRNQGKLALAWPSIELELTDANNKPVLRRVFGPAAYLPPGTQAAAGFGARSEQPVRLNFTLAGLKPSGYHIFVFYP